MISTLAIRAKAKRFAETGDMKLAAELITHIPMLCETIDTQRDLLREVQQAVPILQREIDATQRVIDDLKARPMVATA